MRHIIRAHVEELCRRRDLWDRFPVGIAILDESDRVLYVNPTWLDWIERRAEECIGQDAREVPSLAPRREPGPRTAATWPDQAELPLVVRVQTPSSIVRFLEIHPFSCVTADQRSSGVFQIALDRTHRYVAERNARMAVNGEVAAAIAHEMKNYLAAASGYLDLMERFVDGRARLHLRHVRRQLHALRDHTQRLLAWGRPVDPGSGPVDLEQVLVPAVATVMPQAAARGVYLDVGVAPRPLVVYGQPARLEQVFVNLLLNAVEASPPGGQVWIGFETSPRGIEVVIRDQGAGMPPEVLRRVGEPFFTTKERGSGLGVFVAREILADYHGELSFRSQPGCGTEARVLLQEYGRVTGVAPEREARAR